MGDGEREGERAGERDGLTVDELTVDELVDLLAAGAGATLSPGATVSQLGHALQTAALLEHEHPGDTALALAGLVHDIGHLLPGVGDRAHAAAGAGAVRTSLGDAVARLVGLHIEAKRYLAATDEGYGGALAPDSSLSLTRQGGPMSVAEAAVFTAQPLAMRAVVLRRADDRAKDERAVVRRLSEWVPRLRGQAGPGGTTAR